jgi:hypothetical protein
VSNTSLAALHLSCALSAFWRVARNADGFPALANSNSVARLNKCAASAYFPIRRTFFEQAFSFSVNTASSASECHGFA